MPLSEDKELEIKCSFMSCIGVGGSPPHAWGNYFALGPIRVLNMWWENLEAADKRFNLGGIVRARVYSEWCLIDDDRIPKEWYYNKLCFTGSRAPSKEIAKDMYEFLGDPANEYEQFENPHEYHRKRGGEYKEVDGRGYVSYVIGSKR